MKAQEDQRRTSDPSGGRAISGTIEFQDVSTPTPNVTVYVRVQDTTRADAPARTVAEQVLRGVDVGPGSPPIPFTVEGIPHDPQAHYSVRVHADVDGTGVVTRGDYVSTERHAVQADGQPAVKIVARPVR